MKIAASCYCLEKKFGYETAFRMMKEAGFDAIDYGIDDWVSDEEDVKKSLCYTLSDEELDAHYTKIYECAKALGLEIAQTHALFGPSATRNSPALFRRVTERSIRATARLHCKYIVVHPIATPGRIYDDCYEECHAYNLEFYRAFIPTLKEYGVKIALEPMWSRDASDKICSTVCTRAEEILQLIDELGEDCFCSCPDLGHYALTESSTGDSPADAIRKLGKTVQITHVHEVDGLKDNHTVPFTFPNTMDWDAILKAFHEIGYSGILNFEVGGNYYDAYPERMIPEALRHFAAVARDMADRI